MLRSLISHFDKFLRGKLGVFEFWEHPDALIRISFAVSDRPLQLADAVASPGKRVVEIHFWNEHVPSQSEAKSAMAWAARGALMLKVSFNKLADHLVEDPRFANVELVGGITPLVFTGNHGGGDKVWRRLGFTMSPCKHKLGRFGEFWENVYTWLIMWTFNPDAIKKQNPFTMRRAEFWADRDSFVKLHYRPK
ncbi:hypothetical protein P886_4609 [Alteromonadaceae bacterium 2753L.S.0a.02]|nr:hypothetical protein P886_4609 [Alteromonadaceae bacterium 2753L.S.0a.02]